MEKNNKNENNFEMERVDNLAMERMVDLIRDVMDNPEEAMKKIGEDNYEKVLDFLKREKDEEMAEKKLEEFQEKNKKQEHTKEDKKDRESNYYPYWKEKFKSSSKPDIDNDKKLKTKNISEIIIEEYARLTKDMNEEETIERIGREGWERVKEYRKKQEKLEKE